MEYLCGDSEDAAYLRRHVVFKIVPMLNPDGVVVGNFRTSLCGRDLNRTFKMSNDFLIPEVRALKDLVLRLKGEFKGRFIMFLDLHGHSVKKNVFLYGPEYDIWETNYYKTRIFPKIISNRTPMFRYYSINLDITAVSSGLQNSRNQQHVQCSCATCRIATPSKLQLDFITVPWRSVMWHSHLKNGRKW